MATCGPLDIPCSLWEAVATEDRAQAEPADSAVSRVQSLNGKEVSRKGCIKYNGARLCSLLDAGPCKSGKCAYISDGRAPHPCE